MPNKFRPFLKAISCLLRFSEAEDVAGAIARTVKHSIIANISDLPFLDSIKEATEKCRAATATREDQTEAIRNSTEELRHACTLLREVKESLQSPPQSSFPSYAQVANSHIAHYALSQPPPSNHDPTIPKRQILVEGPGGEAISGLEGLTEKQLTAKASEAIHLIRESGSIEVPSDIQFLGAYRLKRGGVLFRLNTIEATAWIKDVARTVFIEKMGGTVTIKDQTFTVMVNFVPITFIPTPSTIKVLELSNHLSVGSIVSARYIKPAGLRKEGQKVATLYIDFKTEEAADLAIQHKLFIESKLVHPMKKTDQAHRCYKCQKVGTDHISANCRSKHDICGYCGLEHRTKECANREFTPEECYCTNCDEHGHGPGSRLCPSFVKAQNRLLARKPAQAGRFFSKSSYITNQHRSNDDRYTEEQYDALEDGEWITPKFGGRGRGPSRTLPSTNDDNQRSKLRQTTLPSAMNFFQSRIDDPQVSWADEVTANEKNMRLDNEDAPDNSQDAYHYE